MHRQHLLPAPWKKADRDRYDDALRAVYRKYRDWPSVMAACELYLPLVTDGHKVPLPKTMFADYFLDREPPLAYAMALVLAMEGKISLIDFYPYLERFVTAKTPEDTRS
jgi:hypothetical protein